MKTLFKSSFPDSTFLELQDYHVPVAELPAEHRHKLKFGMIRNPWAWYVSLYHFQQPRGKWLQLCSPNKAPSFKEFVTTLLSSGFAQKHIEDKFYPVGNPSAPKTVPVFKYISNLDIGFFTYRYIYMFFSDYCNIFNGSPDVFKCHNELISLDNVLKTEELPNNIINLFAKNNIIISPGDKKLWGTRPKRNHTIHKPYQSYYDKELIELVRYKDRLIIENYGYKFL
ncbi:MAG: hypothetical protein Q8P20_09695 [bacterium]|nr:hypothetical protein [bacterium]